MLEKGKLEVNVFCVNLPVIITIDRLCFGFGCNNRTVPVFQLYCLKYNYEQKQWNTLPVTMIT